MKWFNWNDSSNKPKTIDVHVEGPVTKKLIRKIKDANRGCKIIINGKKY